MMVVLFSLRLTLFGYFLVVAILLFLFFFFNDTATTEIYTLSLHDALPINDPYAGGTHFPDVRLIRPVFVEDRKSTRLNSSHITISYAVFCLKKKKNQNPHLCCQTQNNHNKHQCPPQQTS